MEAESRRAEEIIKQIDHPLFNVQLRSDGIVQVNINDEAYFTLNDSKEYVIAVDQLTNGIPHLILKIPGEHASVDSESRSFMATPEAMRCSIADAIVVKSMAQRIIGNFYIKFDKPDKPVRLFNNIEEAEKWLFSFK